MEIIISFIVVYVVLLIVAFKPDILKPTFLFGIIILATFFITSLRCSYLISRYPKWFIALIFSMVIFFALGDFFADFLPQRVILSNTYDNDKMKKSILILWFAIMFSFLVTVVLLGPPPAISGSERVDYFISGWGSIVTLQSLLFGLLLYDIFNQKAIGRLFWPLILSIMVIAFLLANKYQIIYMIILYLIAYNSFKKKIGIKNLVIASIAVIVVFIIMYEAVYKNLYGVSMMAITYGYKMNLPKGLEFLSQPYLYVAFNYENLYKFLQHDTHCLYGLKTFSSIINTFHLTIFYPQNVLGYLDEWKNMLTVKSMTTGTMLEDFAQDGRLVGMIIFTFLCGMWSKYSYKKFKFDKRFFSFYMYCATTAAIFMSFFTNAFTSKITLINIIGAFIINILLNSKVDLTKGDDRRMK